MRKESETPSGIRLMLLLKGHLREIMDRECANQTSILLYCTGSYWVAFERSAYQLRRAFPDSEITPMRLYAYPFPVVMVSVTDRSLRLYERKHIAKQNGADYKLLTVPELSAPGLPSMAYEGGEGTPCVKLIGKLAHYIKTGTGFRRVQVLMSHD